jgi:hypothetical protein
MKRILMVVAAISILAGAAIAQNRPPARSVWTNQVTPPVAKTNSKPPTVNLTGMWQIQAKGEVQTVRFQQAANQLTEFWDGHSPTDLVFFKGLFDGNNFVGKIHTGSVDSHGQDIWIEATLHIDDPNHVHFGTKGVLTTRMPHAPAGDAGCDPDNPPDMAANDAFLRAVRATQQNESQGVINCWVKVSAVLGHGKGQALVAQMYRDGQGGPKSPGQAFYWAQRSAQQGNPFGEKLLAGLYQKGIGTAQNSQLAQYWQSKVDAQDPQREELAQTKAWVEQQLAQMAAVALEEVIKHPPGYKDPSTMTIRDYQSRQECEAAGGSWRSSNPDDPSDGYRGECWPSIW